MFKQINNFDRPKIYWLIIIIAVLLGTIVRFKGLATWNLALDEYYIIKSSENILKYGLPQFTYGGYYSRGIILQYLIAVLISFGIKVEFAGRFFSVIANLFTIPPIYLISKRIGNIKIATLAIIIFSFSIWEIEFARFARMYTPFQAIFMWYIYLVYEDIKNKNFKNYKWYLLLSMISFLVYEGSIFLAVFNFVPFILNRKIDVRNFFFAIGAFLSSAFFNLFNFRLYNSNPIFPDIYQLSLNVASPEYPIKIPPILLTFAFDNVLSSGLTFLIIGISFYLCSKIIQELNKKDFWSLFSIILLTLFALLNQFGLFALAMLILIFWKLFDFDFSNKKIIILFVSLYSINLIYWFSFGLLSNSWHVLFNDFSSYTTWGITKRLLIGFFNYPDSYFTLFEYLKALPLLTSIFGSFIILLFIKLLFTNEETSGVKFFSASLIFVSLLATIPAVFYQETRYTFFLAPLILIIVTYSAYSFSSLIFKKNANQSLLVFILIMSITFVSSNDFNIYHLMNIDSEEVNYRMIYNNNNYKKHLYRRWDTKTPTEYVSSNMSKDDLIMINENSLEYYLPKVDFFNFDYKHHAFSTISIERGEKERWSGANLIYTNEALIKLIEERESTIWYLIYPEFWLHDINFYERYKDNLVFMGKDKMIKVFKFPSKKNISFSEIKAE